MTDLTAARRQLIALRNKHGHASPIGSRCSTAVETIGALLAEPERQPILRVALAASLTEIQGIVAGAPRSVQARREVA